MFFKRFILRVHVHCLFFFHSSKSIRLWTLNVKKTWNGLTADLLNIYIRTNMYIYEKYYVKMIWSEIRKTLSLAFYLNNIFT